jgi:hypothetical protein
MSSKIDQKGEDYDWIEMHWKLGLRASEEALRNCINLRKNRYLKIPLNPRVRVSLVKL